MFQRLLFLTSFFFIALSCKTQDCLVPTLDNEVYLNANNIRAIVPASGSLFWDGNFPGYNIQGPDGGIATIFSHGLWLAGTDPGGNIKMSTAQYGHAAGNTDYYPGPVAEDGTVDPANCINFDRTWSVYRYEVAAHIADFADNGVIDNPISGIVGWPGRGNPQFEVENGFALPDTPQGAAPFFDANGDGLYQPLAGEYPIVPQSDVQPDQIVWAVFNSAGAALESGSPLSMGFEIQTLGWALNCTDNPVLSNTIFLSFKIINRSVETLSDLRFGLWTDFDLGCFTDDYVGSAPDLNTYFAYNKAPVDSLCIFGVPNAGENPPVQAITVLNQPLDGFMYMLNSSVGGGEPFPPEVLDPQVPGEFYNYLNNQFADGTPLTEGGVGYNPGSTDFVNFAYPGDPNEPDSWSEFVMEPGPRDRRSLGNVAGPASMAPGQVHTLDVAYSYHRAPGAGHLGNVTEMYANVADLQAEYDNAFTAVCSQLQICDDDCIWSGDLNADGIANHEDIIAAGFGLDNTGPVRGAPYSWTPENGDSWGLTQLINGVDNKHLDADGDGQATIEDIDQTVLHYNLTRPDYVPSVVYPPGDDFTVIRAGSGGLTDLEPGESFLARVRIITDNPDLRAIAFTLEYDPVYVETFNPLNIGFAVVPMTLADNSVPGLIDFAYYLRNADEYIDPSTLMIAQVRVLDTPETLLDSDETFIRFRNVLGYLSDGTEIELGATDVRIQINGVAVNTEEPVWAERIRLFPNPVSERLNWTFGNVSPQQYRLLDTQGRVLMEGQVQGNGLDLKHLPAGIYSLQLIHAETAVVRRIVKQ